MIGPKKSQANRANAQASTGPKTELGKSHSARNAWRHGLSIYAVSDPHLSAEIEELAQHIVGANTNSELLEAARAIAAAQIDLLRVRRARHLLLSNALSRDGYFLQSREELKRTIRLMKESLKLEAKLGFPVPMEIPIPPRAEGARKFARVISDLAQQLALMDRYERRARSRRKSAVQAFGAVRRQIQQE